MTSDQECNREIMLQRIPLHLVFVLQVFFQKIHEPGQTSITGVAVIESSDRPLYGGA